MIDQMITTPGVEITKLRSSFSFKKIEDRISKNADKYDDEKVLR